MAQEGRETDGYRRSSPGMVIDGPEEEPVPDRGEAQPRQGSKPEAASTTEGISRLVTPATTRDEAFSPVERDLCVVMGPSQAGKTMLIASFDQACSIAPERESEYTLEFIGEPDDSEDTKKLGKTKVNSKQLRERAIDTIVEPGIALGSTEEVFPYQVTLTATRRERFWRPRHSKVIRIRIWDGPGGFLVPSQELRNDLRNDPQKFSNFPAAHRQLIDDGRRAAVLVLCIDANDPRIADVSKGIGEVLAELGRPYQPPPSLPLGYRLLRHLRLAPTPQSEPWQQRLSVDRFLLLFTKIDTLVSGDLLAPTEAIVPFPVNPLPAQIARRLRPLQVARQCFGEANLLRILNSLRPTTELAVGLTSAWGFDPLTQRAFMENNEPLQVSSQSRERRILDWRPFGVREALLYVASGLVTGPIELVRRESFGRYLQGPPFDVGIPK